METQDWIELGKEHFKNKDYSKAEQYLRQALNANYQFADIYNMLGVISHTDGKFEVAIQHFKKALKINPNYTEALLNLAVLLNDLGKYHESKKLYDHLHKKESGKQQKIEPVLKGKLSNMHAELGDVYQSIGIYDRATKEYEKALELNPIYADIRTKLGVSLREQGDLENSSKELKRVIKEKPAYTLARVQLGITYYTEGKFKEAKKEWEAVLKQDPENESAKIYLKLNEEK